VCSHQTLFERYQIVLRLKYSWENAYTRELQNHTTSPDDEGTIWFSDSGAEEKVIDFLDCYADDGVLYKNSLNEYRSLPTSFLDLGTGNGHLLFALRDAGWNGLMLGVDYSAKSVALAKQIGKERLENLKDEDDESDDEDEGDKSAQPVHFAEYDILNPQSFPAAPTEGFDVVLDKGTFDAISLSSDTTIEGRRICESYAEKVLPLVRKEGLLVITSCNWTEEELKTWFEKDTSEAGAFRMCDRIEYPSFTFGGRKGSSVVTLCFKMIAKR
jgi:SAM-dependent methyltransferase